MIPNTEIETKRTIYEKKKNPARLDVYGNIYGNMNNLILLMILSLLPINNTTKHFYFSFI